MATMVRNHQAGPTTFSDDSTGQKPIVWQGSGDPNRQDVKPVPPAFLESVAFQEALECGIFSIVESDHDSAAIRAAHRAQFQAAQLRQQSVSEALEERPDNDILVLDCIGPEGKSGKVCGVQVTVKSSDQGTVPPLCTKHSYLKSQFVPMETDRVVAGRPEVTWTRPRMGQPMKSSSE
jgi:hypothetical protein